MIKILVVEDEKPISDLIKLNLRKEGFDCTQVYDGLDAIDLIDKEHFDLVLLDTMLLREFMTVSFSISCFRGQMASR